MSNIKPRRRNPLALVVLAQLLERPMHPYEIAAQMRQRGHHDVIKLNYGALYAVVEALEEEGLIASGETRREGRRPERTVYSLTDTGRAFFRDWLSDILRQPAVEYPLFAAGLALMAGLPPQEVSALLEERVVALERAIGEGESSLALHLKMLPRLFLVEQEYDLHMKRAELEWVRGLAGEIADGKLPGVREWSSLHAPGGMLAAPERAHDPAGGSSAKQANRRNAKRKRSE
jgi:DNA-binding PadR family transcriptional regulator